MADKKDFLMTIYNGMETSLVKQAEALPKGFNTKRFIQNCMSVLQEGTVDYSKCSPDSVKRTLIKGAYLGLDFFSKECYAIPYGGTCTFQTDYKGEKKLAKKYSIRPILDIYAKVVHEGDFFEEKIINGKQTIDFIPKSFNDGEIIGAFAVVVYRDGGMDYEVMSKADIENSRKKSKMQNGMSWKDFYGEMCKKTVLRRLCKHIELDFETVEMAETFTEAGELNLKKEDLPKPTDPFTVYADEPIDVESVEVEGEQE